MRSTNITTRSLALIAFATMFAGVALCQEAPASRTPANRGWRRVAEAPPPATDPASQAPGANVEQATTPAYPEPSQPPNEAPPPVNGTSADPNPGYRPLDAYGQSRDNGQSRYPDQQQPMQRGPYPPQPNAGGYSRNMAVPPELNVRPGTYLTVRIDQPLSSDHNHAGDAFSATLVKPLVIDGVVVAQRGQTLGGRVVESQKAGRVEGVSKLAVELVDMGLADGQQVPIKSQFVSRTGPTAFGRDAAGIGTTTLAGAAIGAGVNGGVGAGVGAAAGLVVGTVGVLLTRGHPTIIYPESVLTFRIETPIVISTVRAPQAFRYVDPQDYERADNAQQRYPAYSSRPQSPAPYYYGSPYYGSPYYGPSLYPYYPFYGGFSFYYGPRFYGGYYRGGGYFRGYRR